MFFNYIIINIFIIIFLFIIFRGIILLIFRYLDNGILKKETANNKFQKIINRYPFLVSLIIILILWLPYIISFYPTILSPDPSYQIKQYFGIQNKYLNYSVLLDPNVTITNHHPVVHTMLLGTSLKIGHSLGNDNFGLFIYSIIQILVLSCTLSYTIKYLTKIKISYKYRFITLLVYSLVPMFPLYAMSAVKDTIFTSFIILYIILIYHLIKNKKIILKLKHLFIIAILFILIILFRNNGFYVLLLSFPLVVIFNKKNFQKLLILFTLIISFNVSYNKVILPYFKITPGSIREVLSIPFQQTARYTQHHILTKEESKIYDKILDISDLKKRYNPEISDPVKNKFNKYTTNKELKEYFKYWFKDLLKDPVLYVDSTINNTYGYFYPIKTKWYIYHKYDDRIVKDGFDYHYNPLNNSRSILSNYGKIFPYIPIIGLISNIGFNTWILFFLITYLIKNKKYRGIIYLTPLLVILLVCVASPVNTYFRYAMPYVFSMPIVIGLFINYIGSENNEKNKNSSINTLL